MLTYNRGLIKGKVKKDFKGAIDDFNKALMIDPNNVRILINIALAYGFNGDLKDARKSLKKAVKIDPTNEKARGMLSQLEQEMGVQ